MKNITRIGFKEHAKLNETVIRLRSLPMIIIYIFAVLVFAVYGLIIKNWFIAILGFSIALIFPLFSYFFFKSKIKSTYERYKDIYNDIYYEFDFDETGVKLVLVQKTSRNELFTPYEKLHSVVETKEYIFLFLDSKRTYIVSIEGFDNFDRVEFRSLVQTKVKKYRIMGK